MLSLSAEQHKQGPAEIARLLVHFLGLTGASAVPGKKQQAPEPFMRRAPFELHHAGTVAAARTSAHRRQMFAESGGEGESRADGVRRRYRERGARAGGRGAGRWDAKSQIYGSFRCFSFVRPPPRPLSSISCGDLSFPAGPKLISYWSSGLSLRDGQGATRGGERAGGI